MQRRFWVLLVSGLIAGAVFAIDLKIPLGVAAAVPYIIAVFVSYWTRRPSYVAAIAMVCTLLTVVAFFIPVGPVPDADQMWIVRLNRFLAILAIWVVAFLCQHRIRVEAGLARMAAIVASSNDAIIGTTLSGKTVSWNEAAKRTYGYPAKEIVGKNVAQLVPNDRQDEFERLLARVKQGEDVRQQDAVHVTRDGRRIDVSLAISPIKDAWGKIVGASIISRDVTEQKHAEQRFHAAVESAPNAMVMIDRQGTIVMVNRETERVFGYGRDELIGQAIEMLVPERFREAHPGYRDKFFAEPKVRRMGEGRELFGLRKDGTEFPVEIGLNPIHTREGMFVLSAIVDITERNRSNRQLQLKTEEMEQFIYIVSHDLKSPLVTGLGFLGLLKDDLAAGRVDDVLDSIDRIERANKRMSQLIDDLLQFSRVGRIRDEPEEIDVTALVQQIGDDLAPQLEAARAKLEIQENMPHIVADSVRVREVFENLLTNAIKYGCSAEQPKITIGSVAHKDELRYYVRDNGDGIPEEHHERVFGVFQRLKSDEKGTGVGLAIVARVMQLHGGTAWIESAPGDGATFWLSFPKKVTNSEE